MKLKGFSLIELMITVTIVGVLAAIAVPMYSKYIKGARTSEAVSNLGAIGMYEETYFSEFDNYTLTFPNPSAVPGPSDPGGKKAFSTSITGWANLGRVIPDGTNVYFQYEVRAGQYGATSATYNTAENELIRPTDGSKPGGTDCSNTTNMTAGSFSIPDTANSNWFYATAVADQDGDGVCALFVKVLDRTDIIKENPIE